MRGFCASIPRWNAASIPPADLDYLANLCHNCGECYYACQYAPPHEFAVNMPKLLAELRLGIVLRNTRGRNPGSAYRARAGHIAVDGGMSRTWSLCSATEFTGPAISTRDLARSMAGLFGAVSAFAVMAMGIGLARFWRATGMPCRPAALGGLRDALTLRYLGRDAFGSQSRRVFTT